MNLLFLCDEYPPGRHGGIGTSVQLLARALVRQGHKVVVAGFCDWGYGGADVETDQGVLVYRFRRIFDSPLFSGRDSIPVRAAYKIFKATHVFQYDITASLKRYGRFLIKLIKEHKIELAEMPDYNEYVNYINKYTPFPRLPVPVVVKLHGSLTYIRREANRREPDFIWRTEHEILQQAAVVASVSGYTAGKTAGYLKYDRPIKVLYNGIELPAVGEEIKDQGVGEKVVYSGSLLKMKGIYQLMKAWNSVHKSMPDASLWIYGKGPVAQVQAILSEEAKASVHFQGHVSRASLFESLSAADIAVFPSYIECFSLAPMEAMACGTAVIYTKRTSGPELIREGVDGMLVNPDDTDELANKIITLLKDGALRNRLAAEGKGRVITRFDINVIAKQHADFYEEILRNLTHTGQA